MIDSKEPLKGMKPLILKLDGRKKVLDPDPYGSALI
jgi:hypothetical protein